VKEYEYIPSNKYLTMRCPKHFNSSKYSDTEIWSTAKHS
jgi:hypothetical protein